MHQVIDHFATKYITLELVVVFLFIYFEINLNNTYLFKEKMTV